MTDLSDRLRKAAWYKRRNGDDLLMQEAAARIAELEAKLDRIEDELDAGVPTSFGETGQDAAEKRAFDDGYDACVEAWGLKPGGTHR